MKNPVQVIGKMSVVSLLISSSFLGGCFDLKSIPGLSPEQQELIQKMVMENLKQKEEERRILEDKLSKQAEEHKKQKEEWEKKKQQEEKEREQKEHQERLEREEKERKAKEDQERKQREAEEKSKKKLAKVELDSEIRRVAEIMEKVSNNPTLLEKTVEEIAAHGKIINQALKDDFIGYNLEWKSSNAFTDTDVAVLVNHPSLKEIVEFKLDSLKLGEPQLKVLLSHLDSRSLKSQHLRKLGIRYEQLANVGVTKLLPLFQGENSSFSYLNLYGGNAKDDLGIMQDLAKYLSTLAGLKYLHFSNSGFLTLAPSLKLLPDLRYLDLDGCNIGDTGMQTLAPCFKGINYLIGLNLSGNDLGPVGAKTLAAHFKNLANLRIFKLDLNYKIGLQGIEDLTSQFSHLAKLHGLSLRNTLVQAGDAGAKLVATSLKHLANLRVLRLESNDLSDQGVQYLMPSLYNLSLLYTLSLADNHISGVGVNSLVQYLNTGKRKEFHLYLGSNQLGDSVVQSFLNLSKDLKKHQVCLGNNDISNIVESKLKELDHVQWNIGSNSHIKSHTAPYFEVDSSCTSSKESILGTNF